MTSTAKKLQKKDLISLADISSGELLEILSLTKELKEKPLSKAKALLNKNVALIFAKPSLRTRISFEVGIQQLGGHPITIKMDEISIGKREDVEDIGHVLSKYVNGVVIRTFEQKQIQELGEFATIPVINGLSNEEHPCQVIADIFTIKEHFKNFSGIKIAYVGDGNNIANSLIICSALAGINISVASPKNYEPMAKYIEIAKSINPSITVELTSDPAHAAKDASVIYTDTWTSMGQEAEAKKRKEIFIPYQVNDELLSHANKDAIVLHCLPAHKGEEITNEAFEKHSEIIYKQAENRLHTQKAILVKLISDKD